MAQVDSSLGEKVRQHLISKGLETPLKPNSLTDDQKLDVIEQAWTTIFNTLGYDLSDDSLTESPRRIAKKILFDENSGLDYSQFPKCTTVENKMAAEDEFVMVKNIKFISSCEHHASIMYGAGKNYEGITIAYIPHDRVLGISKTARVAEFFCKRYTIQERTTNQILEAFKFILGTDNVAVYIEGKHTCMTARGINDPAAVTVTFAGDGLFKFDPNVRKEFLAQARESLAAAR